MEQIHPRAKLVHALYEERARLHGLALPVWNGGPGSKWPGRRRTYLWSYDPKLALSALARGTLPPTTGASVATRTLAVRCRHELALRVLQPTAQQMFERLARHLAHESLDNLLVFLDFRTFICLARSLLARETPLPPEIATRMPASELLLLVLPDACITLHTKLVAHFLLCLELIHLPETADHHATTRELLAATLHTAIPTAPATSLVDGTVFTKAIAVALRKATCLMNS